MLRNHSLNIVDVNDDGAHLLLVEITYIFLVLSKTTHKQNE